MTGVLDIARRALSAPVVYDTYQQIVGAPKMIRRFVADYIRPQSGHRLLDVGCGTGAVMRYLPHNIELLGIDISNRYIRTANARYGERGTYRCVDASDTGIDLGSPFDTAFALGVLHHMSDGAARHLVEGALARLKPGGRFVALDPTLVDGQGWVSRTIVKADRGEFIRTPQRISSLLSGLGARFEVVDDMLNIPFAQVITVIESAKQPLTTSEERDSKSPQHAWLD